MSIVKSNPIIKWRGTRAQANIALVPSGGVVGWLADESILIVFKSSTPGDYIEIGDRFLNNLSANLTDSEKRTILEKILLPATADGETLGAIKVGLGLGMNEATGVLSISPASESSLGGIIAGQGLEVDESGNLSSSANRYIIAKSPNDTGATWYEIYNDGWVVQGGRVTTNVNTSPGTQVTINGGQPALPVAMEVTKVKNAKVDISNAGTNWAAMQIRIQPTSSIVNIDAWYNSGVGTGTLGACVLYWEVKGYGTESGIKEYIPSFEYRNNIR